jgi:type IV secretion system protein VirD4
LLPITAEIPVKEARASTKNEEESDAANSGVRREPALPEHEAITPEMPASPKEFDFADSEADDEPSQVKPLGDRMRSLARQASLDPDDGLQL